MNPHEYIQKIIPHNNPPMHQSAQAFAPSNIALCKYWGKANPTLNKPITDSLSLSLGHLGATTTIQCNTTADQTQLNGQIMPTTSTFAKRIHEFLALFPRAPGQYFTITSDMNIPVASGLASSACGFAALTEALNQLYDWQLSQQQCSQISRLGSGSACRSHWHGFVQWHKGHSIDALDCHASAIDQPWPELRLAIVLADTQQKPWSSRQAMAFCQQTSPSYNTWPDITANTLSAIKHAIFSKNIQLLGTHSQSHAQRMHAIMAEASPSIVYDTTISINIKEKIARLQHEGHPIFYTQDAGPHIKLIFLSENIPLILEHFPSCQIINPWASVKHEETT
jgi:diphosphomevalonate decarboxylase